MAKTVLQMNLNSGMVNISNKKCMVDVCVFPETSDFDRAVVLTDYGRFHYEIVAVCAVCLLVVGFQNAVSAYIFPAAQCELNLTSLQIGFLNSSFLVGGLCSAFVWGLLADCSGRRKVLAFSMLVDFLVTIASSFMQCVAGIGICRFINGFIIGAPGSITFTYLAEFHAPQHRPKIICYSGIFFTLAWVLMPVLALLILPLELDFGYGFSPSSWRLVLVSLSIPELIGGLWLLRLPESPKFLASKGNSKEALAILKHMFTVNTGQQAENYPVRNLSSDTKVASCVPNSVLCRGKTKRLLEDINLQIMNLFSKPFQLSIFVLSIIMFSNMFGLFGLGLWLPQLFSRFKKYEIHQPEEQAANFTFENVTADKSCAFVQDADVFENTVLIGVSCLVGNIVSGWFADKVTLRTIPMCTMLIGGLSAGTVNWLRSATQNLVVACIFQTAMSIGNTSLGSIVVDVFPTSISGMAICFVIFAGRFGAITSNIVFGTLMDEHCEIPLLLVAVLVILGGILAYLIPDTTNPPQMKEYLKKDIDNKKNNIGISVI